MERGRSPTGICPFYNIPFLPALNARIEELVEKKGVSMAQISIAWILQKDGVTAPIVGTTSLANLEEMIGALGVKLTEEEVKYLEEPYQPLNVLGHS